MVSLQDNIAAFDRLKSDLEARHPHDWVLFHDGKFVGAFLDFETAASLAVDRFEDEPCLIRQMGAGPVRLAGGMIFRPAHALDTGGL